ncbi:MAG: phytoene desaturase family protein [bacterium]
MKKKVIIVGAGPGGLTAGMLLASRGLEVVVVEKADRVGGRNRSIQIDGYTFDTGPTFLMLEFILRGVFYDAGKKLENYITLKKLDPMYCLRFANATLYPTQNQARMREQIENYFPGNVPGFERFLVTEKHRFEQLYPCLQKAYSSLAAFFDLKLLKALPSLSLGKTLFANLGRYFTDDDLKIAFTFQSKYLGMSPWECPALFTILSYMEYAYGVYHVMGGLHKISEAMARVIQECDGTIHLKTPVKKVLVEKKVAKGVLLENGSKLIADDVILNADFSYAVEHLLPLESLKKWTPKVLEKKQYSCSTFMIYLGLKKRLSLNHHTIIFANDYRANVDSIFSNKPVSDDFSFYIQNASVTDPSLAPEGKSALYVLVPVPNNRSGIDWESQKEEFKNKVIDTIIKKTGYGNLRDAIEVEKVISPYEWEHSYNVYRAAEFSMAHTFKQLLYLRPHNRFEDIAHCYLVGGGTHPGSGLPTIYESGRITSDLLCDSYGIRYVSARRLDAHT